MPDRSDEADRRAVIRGLEAHLGIRLDPVGRRRKYLQDESGQRYCICVGREQLHGLPHAIAEDAQSLPRGVLLVVATKLADRMSIFTGPMTKLTQNLSQLSSSKDQYLFNVSRSGQDLTVDQARSMRLQHLCDIPYGKSEHERMTKLRNAEKIIGRSTVNEKRAFLAQLKKGI